EADTVGEGTAKRAVAVLKVGEAEVTGRGDPQVDLVVRFSVVVDRAQSARRARLDGVDETLPGLGEGAAAESLEVEDLAEVFGVARELLISRAELGASPTLAKAIAARRVARGSGALGPALAGRDRPKLVDGGSARGHRD